MSELIYAFDSSLTHFGYGICRVEPGVKPHFVAVGVIVTKPGDAPTKTEDTRTRVEGIARSLRMLVTAHGRPTKVAVEALALPLGRTSLVTVSALGRARGLVDALAVEHGLSAIEFQPQALKKAVTGRRDAEKVEVQNDLCRAHPELTLLFAQLKAANVEHAADACAAVHAVLSQSNSSTNLEG